MMTRNYFKLYIEYNYVEHQLKLDVINLRRVAEQYGDVGIVKLVSYEDLQPKKWNNSPLHKSEICSTIQIIRVTKTSQIKHASTFIYHTNIGLHTTSTLYAHSSMLSSYDTLIKLNMDTIIQTYLFARATTS